MTNNMRTAIRSCINIDSIVQSVYMSMVDRTNTPMIQGTWMYNSNLSSFFQVDLNKARQLLDEPLQELHTQAAGYQIDYSLTMTGFTGLAEDGSLELPQNTTGSYTLSFEMRKLDG